MKDLFSNHSKQYAQFRPVYPDSLYQFIYSHVNEFNTAWDCGTGNGQAAQVLAKKFKKVYATDISVAQMNNASKANNILYSVTSEQTSFPDQSIDLITVAQAIHWFDRNKFYQEVRRVAKPRAILAVWGYSLLSINNSIDSLIQSFYTNKIGSYWDKERHLIDERYKTIQFPFEEIKAPEFNFSFVWTREQLQGYLTTWSAVQKYLQTNKTNPVIPLMDEIKPYWLQDTMTITFPLFLRLGRVDPS